MKKLKKLLSNKLVPIAIGATLVGATGGIFGTDSTQWYLVTGLFLGWSLNEFVFGKYVV